MQLWRIRPIAAADDPGWLDGPQWQEVIVRADRPAEARIVAAEEEARKMDYSPSRNQAGGQAMAYTSSLHSEKLYHVGPGDPHASSKGDPADGPPEVLRMTPRR